MTRSKKTLLRDQISQFYFADEGPRDALGLYVRMFVEDVSQGLVPPSARLHDSKPNVELTPPNDDVAGILARALDTSHSPGYHREFPNALFEFLRYTMVDICLHNRAVYEIVYLREREDGPPTGFEFTHLSGRQLVEKRGHLFQGLPRESAAERGSDELIFLPEERLAVFTLPEPHGGMIRDAMRSLRILSDLKWHQLAVDAQNSKTLYDFATHERSFSIALAESVRGIGWGARASFQRKVTNYYWLRQEFRFRRFEMEVREILIEQLNEVMQRVGPRLGWSAQITVKGLPIGTDYERALTQLEQGTKPFIEIMDSVREYAAGPQK
jgi:hypothetical protein